MKATEQYFFVVLFFVLCEVILSLQSVVEIYIVIINFIFIFLPGNTTPDSSDRSI